jgi:hypothetical protein
MRYDKSNINPSSNGKKEHKISLEEGSNQVELQVLLSVMNYRMQKVLISLQRKLNTLFPNSKATELHPTSSTDFAEQYSSNHYINN